MTLGYFSLNFRPQNSIILLFYLLDQEYKVPSCKDIPEDFRVTFNDSKRNTYAGVLGSKAVGEQAMMMGVSVIFALRRAIDSVRRDLGQSPLPFYTLGNVWKSVKKRSNFGTKCYLLSFRWTRHSRENSKCYFRLSRTLYYLIIF